VIPGTQNPESDPARFLGPAAAAEWRVLMTHLDFQTGFGLFVLLLPGKAGASWCEQALANHFLATNGELKRLRFANLEQLRRLPSALLDQHGLRKTDALWVDLLDPSPAPTSEWQLACRQTLGLLNQHRNRLVVQLPVPVFFVGEPWLQIVMREAAPDLWSIRRCVARLETAATLTHLELGRSSTMITGKELAIEAAADPDYALEQARKLPDTPQTALARGNLLLRAAAGFYQENRLDAAEATAREARALFASLTEQDYPKCAPALANANILLTLILRQLGGRTRKADKK